MSIGALAGYLLAKNNNVILLFKEFKMAVFITCLTLILWFFKVEFKYFTDEFFAVLFAFMILSLTICDKINIDFYILKFLGKISY